MSFVKWFQTPYIRGPATSVQAGMLSANRSGSDVIWLSYFWFVRCQKRMWFVIKECGVEANNPIFQPIFWWPGSHRWQPVCDPRVKAYCVVSLVCAQHTPTQVLMIFLHPTFNCCAISLKPNDWCPFQERVLGSRQKTCWVLSRWALYVVMGNYVGQTRQQYSFLVFTQPPHRATTVTQYNSFN